MLLPNETLLKAISWTLLHSLWQGLILAIFAGFVILFTKKAKANLRYSILTGLFLVFMIAVGFTFNYEYQSSTISIASEEIIVVNDFDQDVILLPATAPDYFQMGINYLNQNSTAIVLIWFLIFSIKCFGIFRSLSHIYRIRNYRNQAPPEYWNQRILELSQMLKIKKHIVLLESQLVSVPSVTGFFKPIILMPIGLFSNLPQDQIEAILLHELAHIRRKDYFINILQNFAEILFFFNPGVLWVSSIIKEERENCCDDIAVGITKNKSKFINALLSFQEYNMKQNELAIGFGRKKNQLLERAKRIIYDNNKSLNAIEKTFLSICIIIIASFTVACSNTKAATSQLKSDILFSEDIAEGRPATDEELLAYEQAIMDAEVAEAQAEIAELASEEVAIAANLSEEELQQMEADAIQARKDGEQARKDGKQARKDGELSRIEGERGRKDGELSRIAGERGRKDGELSRIAGEKARKEGEQSRKEGELARIEGEKGRKAGEKARIESEKARIESMKAKTEADKARKISQQQKLEMLKERLEERQRILDAERVALESQIEIEKIKDDYSSVYVKVQSNNQLKSNNKVVMVGEVIPADVDDISTKIIKDLIAEKIISSTKNLSYKLSKSKLIVNDKEISEAVQKKLKKYLPEGITATYYNYDISSEK